MTRTLIQVDREYVAWQQKRKVLKAQFYANERYMSDILITRYRTVIADHDAKISELSEELKEIQKPN